MLVNLHCADRFVKKKIMFMFHIILMLQMQNVNLQQNFKMCNKPEKGQKIILQFISQQ